jgi:hypothetical protein
MRNLSNRERDSCEIDPCAVHAYVDTVHLWLKRPLSEKKLEWLRRQCGHLHAETRSGPWKLAKYKQYLQLQQPNDSALQAIAERQHHITRVDFALDWIFIDKDECNRAYRDFCRYNVVKFHSRRQGVRFVKTTRYTAGRTAPNNLVVYADKPSKVSGKPCLHLDWRIKGTQALKRAGISSVKDLIKFDHRAFWEERLRLCTIDPTKLGINYHNHTLGTNRRKPWVMTRFRYQQDRTIGGLMIRTWGMQRILNRYGPNLRQHVVDLDVSNLLPKERAVRSGFNVDTSVKTRHEHEHSSAYNHRSVKTRMCT